MRLTLTVLFGFALAMSAYAQVPSYVPADGLVGWWPFDGNANDVSGNGHNGTVNAAVLASDRFGTASSAYSFNGSSSYILMGSMPELASSGSPGLTVSIWMNSSSFSTVNTDLFDLRSSDNSGFYIYSNNGEAGVLVGGYFDATGAGGGANGGVFSSFPSLNQWYHLVYVQDIAADFGQLYINGTLIGSDAVYDPAMINPKLNVGSRYDASNIRCCYFSGLLDDIGFWNRALTPNEIAALYSLQGPAPCVSSTAVSYSGLDASYLTSDGPSTLVGSPLGGVFIGPGVAGDTFDPATTGAGTHSIMYVYVDENNCVNSAGSCTTVELGVGIGGGAQMATGGVRVFPNPNGGQFSVELDLMGLVSMQVYDAKGKLVHNEVFQANGAKTVRSLDLSRQAKASYTLQVQNNGGTVTQTVVVE